MCHNTACCTIFIVVNIYICPRLNQGIAMGLTRADIVNYLHKKTHLHHIDNHEVVDENGTKQGQTPLTIELAKERIAKLSNMHHLITNAEKIALNNLLQSLKALPIPFSWTDISMLLGGLAEIQQNLLTNMTSYLASIKSVTHHQDILKPIVLVLRIFEYDLDKVQGPIEKGFGWFKTTILSNSDRITNLKLVKDILSDILQNYPLQKSQTTQPSADEQLAASTSYSSCSLTRSY